MSHPRYMDEHVRSEFADGLRMRGIDVLAATEDGHGATPDPLVLQRAAQLGRVLFSQDADLLAIAAHWQKSGISFNGLVDAHRLGITIGQCIADLELIRHVCTADELRNRVIYLPL